MKKFSYLMVTFVILVCMFVSGCGPKGFELAHFDGSDISNGYDTDLLYKNDSEFWGGDSGVIWVSEEDGAKLMEKGVVDKNGESLGGYFYQYMSSCAGVSSYGFVTDIEIYENQETKKVRGASYIVCTRSRDLNDWEICGAVDSGMAIFAEPDQWMKDWAWAPETIHLPWNLKDASGEIAPYAGKYVMYFSARTRSWTPELGELGAVYGNIAGTAFDGFAFGVAVSDSPAGPFRLANSENFYGNAKAKQPVTKDFLGNDFYGVDDGINEVGVLSGINPTVLFSYVGKDSGLTDTFTPIDLSPCIDDDGSLYLTFVKHNSTVANQVGFAPAVGNQIWGMRMIDPITPDYSSVRKLVSNHSHEKNKGYTVQVVWKGDEAIAEGMSVKDALAKYPVWRDYPIYVDPTHENDNYDIVEGGDCSYEYIDTFADGTVADKSVGAGLAEAPNLIKSKDKNGKTKYIITYSPKGVGWYDYDVVWAYADSPLGPYSKPKADERFLLDYDEKTSYMTNLGHTQLVTAGDEIWYVHWEGDRPNTGDTGPGRIYACAQATWQYSSAYDIYLPIGNGPSISLQALPSVATGYTNVASRAKVEATNAIGDTTKYLNDGLIVTSARRAEKEFSFKKSTKITFTFDTPVNVRGLLIYNAYDLDYAFKNIKNIQFSLAEKPTWYKGESDGLSCYIKNLGFKPSYIYTTGNDTSTCTASIATFNEIKVNKIEIEIDAAYGNNEEIKISDIVVIGK